MPYALPTHNRIPPVASNVTSNQLGERERVDRKRRSLSVSGLATSSCLHAMVQHYEYGEGRAGAKGIGAARAEGVETVRAEGIEVDRAKDYLTATKGLDVDYNLMYLETGLTYPAQKHQIPLDDTIGQAATY
ncbi:glycoside hydrolase family 5 protein [Moniliophthora roreri]|nr:glycoside hydrolase family 5 protein [Moniliophthora roreri]